MAGAIRKLYGEIFLRESPKGPMPIPWDAEDLKEVPGNVTPRLFDVMHMIYEMCIQIKEMGNRDVPLTRGEVLEHAITKKEIHKLAKFGLLKEKLINLLEVKTKKKKASRNIVYFTEQGRAFIRKHFNPEYCKKGFDLGYKDNSKETL